MSHTKGNECVQKVEPPCALTLGYYRKNTELIPIGSMYIPVLCFSAKGIFRETKNIMLRMLKVDPKTNL